MRPIEFTTEFISSATRNIAGRSSLSETDTSIPTECKEEPLLAVCRSVAISNSASLRFPICVAGGFKALRVLFDFYNSTGFQPVLRLHNSVLPEKM
jgi:hypothetical protein